MTYVPITYIPDGPVTSALKKHVKGRRPKPDLGNLGPLLDENLNAARKHGHFLYHPDDLRRLKGVRENPEIVDEAMAVLTAVMADKNVAEPDRWERAAPYYQNRPQTLWRTGLLAAVMTIAITIAVVVGQEDYVAAMVVAIVAVSLVGAALFMLILDRSVIHVGTIDEGP